MRFGPGADNEASRTIANTDGVLKTDVHSLWPPQQEIMIATTPEMFPVEKRLFYAVRGDGRKRHLFGHGSPPAEWDWE